jgi:hypothetical protein
MTQTQLRADENLTKKLKAYILNPRIHFPPIIDNRIKLVRSLLHIYS